MKFNTMKHHNKSVFFTLLIAGLLTSFPALLFASASDGSTANSKSQNIIQKHDLTEASQVRSKTAGEAASGGFEILSGEQEAVLISDPVAVPIDRPDPFLATAGSWQATADIPGQVHFELRFSEDGEKWNGWEDAGLDPDALIEDGLHHGTLIFADEDTRYIQYRLRIKRDEDGVSPQITELKLHFISPGSSSPELKQTVNDKSYANRSRDISSTGQEKRKDAGSNEIMDDETFPLPDYVDRETWGAQEDLNNKEDRRLEDVTHLVVHHSGGNTTASDFAAVVRSYWDFHTHGRGWGDIGYNWLVDPDGVVYQGRAFNLDGNKDVRGTHAGGFNSNSMGVCIIGDYSQNRPAREAVSSMNEVLAWKADERGLDPMGSSVHAATGNDLPTIQGHRDVTATSCPGAAFYAMLPEIRRDVGLLVEAWFDPDDVFVEENWNRSFDDETAFGWMGSGSSETELSLDYHDGVVYVASSSDGSRIYKIDADDGSEIGYIDFEQAFPDLEDFTIATVRATDDGFLVASNRTANAATNPFRIVVLEPSFDNITREIVFDETDYRVGNQLTVSGSVGNLDIYAPVSNENKVIRWQGFQGYEADAESDMETAGDSYAHIRDILEVPEMDDWGRQAALAVKERAATDGFFVGGLRSDVIREYDTDWASVGRLSFADGDTELSGLRHSAYQGREYLFAYHPDDRKVRWHSLFGEPGDADTDRSAYQLYLSDALGSTDNRTTINIGDLTVRNNLNGSFDVFVLAPNNGIWSFNFEGPEYEGPVAAEDEPRSRPDSYRLAQNYPNPFNPVTQIRYEIPESADVRIEIYNSMGQRVTTLVNEHQQAGEHEATFDASGLSSGVYVYRIIAGDFVQSRQMTFIK